MCHGAFFPPSRLICPSLSSCPVASHSDTSSSSSEPSLTLGLTSEVTDLIRVGPGIAQNLAPQPGLRARPPPERSSRGLEVWAAGTTFLPSLCLGRGALPLSVPHRALALCLPRLGALKLPMMSRSQTGPCSLPALRPRAMQPQSHPAPLAGLGLILFIVHWGFHLVSKCSCVFWVFFSF